MTQNAAPWLTEIQTLQQQLAVAYQEREQAYASATNWQRLYETEAQQRRSETVLAQQVIEQLTQEVHRLQGISAGESGAEQLAVIEAEVAQLQTVPALQAKLVEVMATRDRLLQALKDEQVNHAQTRKGLTTALGDAIDQLSRTVPTTEPNQHANQQQKMQ
jgi:hypothetical protein